MKPTSLPWRSTALALLSMLLVAADAARSSDALARASATVVEPVAVTAWLGAPVSVHDLLAARDGPAGPATGALVPRVPANTAPPLPPRLPTALILGAVESRSAFGLDLLQDASLLARGPAAALIAAPDHDGDSPLVITVSFN